MHFFCIVIIFGDVATFNVVATNFGNELSDNGCFIFCKVIMKVGRKYMVLTFQTVVHTCVF